MAIKNVYEKMTQDGIDVDTMLNVDRVYDDYQVVEQARERNVHPERPAKKRRTAVITDILSLGIIIIQVP